MISNSARATTAATTTGAFRRRYIVADLDDTLVHKPPPGSRRKPSGTKGQAQPKRKGLAESPCFQPILSWLKAGNGLVVVTTDDGVRPYQLWDALPPASRCNGQTVLATSDGAALYSGDEVGTLHEVCGYKSSAAAAAVASAAASTAPSSPGVAPKPSTGLPQGGGMAALLDICRELIVSFTMHLLIDDGDGDGKLYDSLPPTQQAQWKPVIARLNNNGNEPTRGDVEALLSPDNLLVPSKLFVSVMAMHRCSTTSLVRSKCSTTSLIRSKCSTNSLVGSKRSTTSLVRSTIWLLLLLLYYPHPRCCPTTSDVNVCVVGVPLYYSRP